MDNNFEGDDFFNEDSLQQINDDTLQNQIDQLDASAVGIGVPPAVALPINPNVLDRLVSLHQNGCATRVAWSRQGQIAAISEDGVSVDLHYLLFDRRKRTWALSTKQTVPASLGRLASLAWSPVSTDLAIADKDGNVSVLRRVGTVANRLTEIKPAGDDATRSFGPVVGMYWLSQDHAERSKQIVQNTSKTQENGKWAHRHVKALSLQPFFSRAIALVSHNATFALIYEKRDGSFGRVSCPLPSRKVASYTHAAFAPTTSGKLLIAIHSDAGIISAFTVAIDFTPVSSDGLPSLNIELVASELPCISNESNDNQLFNLNSQYLTHLGIIQTTEAEKSTRLPPTVYGIYANTDQDVTNPNGTLLPTGTIRRWTVSHTEQVLYAKFNDHQTKTKQAVPTQPGETAAIENLPDQQEQAITNAVILENGHGLHITTVDGRTDILSTEDMSSLTFPSADGSISSLAQSSLLLPLISNPALLALSPNQSCAVTLSSKHSLDLLSTQYQQPDPTQILDPDTPAGDAANAAIVLAFARSCWTSSNIDDLLCMAMHTLPSNMATPLIISLYQSLFRETEFIHEKDSRSELEKVVQKPVLNKVFSFHYGISFLATPPESPMPLSTQWIWIASNLRFVAQLLYMSIREVQPPTAKPSADFIDMVCGNIKWTLDLIRWIAATVIETSDRESNPEFFNPIKHADQFTATGSQGLVALLLNCHWSRQFLIAIVRAMRVLCKVPEPRSVAQNQIMRTIMQWSSGKGCSLIAVDALLDPRWSGLADGELGNDMAKISARQVRMMASGRVEGGYEGTVRRIATMLFNQGGNMRERKVVERLKLWQSRVDLGWILLDDGWEGAEGEGKKKGEGRRYDVHKKKVIIKGVKEAKAGEDAEEMIKRCVRCGRHGEDVNGMGKEFPRHIAGLMMRCVCDGPWIIEPWSRTDED